MMTVIIIMAVTIIPHDHNFLTGGRAKGAMMMVIMKHGTAPLVFLYDGLLVMTRVLR